MIPGIWCLGSHMTLPLDNHVKAPFYSSKTFTHPQTISLNTVAIFSLIRKVRSLVLCSCVVAWVLKHCCVVLCSVSACVCIYVYVYVHVCLCVYVYVCLFVCRHKARCDSCCPRTVSLRLFDVATILQCLFLDGRRTDRQQLAFDSNYIRPGTMNLLYLRFASAGASSLLWACWSFLSRCVRRIMSSY